MCKQVQRTVIQVVHATDGSEAVGHSEHGQKQHSLSSSLLHVEPLGIRTEQMAQWANDQIS